MNDFSRYTWIYFIHRKSDVFRVFTSFYIPTFCKRITTLRSDGVGEYLSHEMQDYLRLHGIRHEKSCPSTPEQNGLAKRKHRRDRSRIVVS